MLHLHLQRRVNKISERKQRQQIIKYFRVRGWFYKYFLPLYEGLYICLAYNCKIVVLVAKYLGEMSEELEHPWYARDDRHRSAMAIVISGQLSCQVKSVFMRMHPPGVDYHSKQRAAWH